MSFKVVAWPAESVPSISADQPAGLPVAGIYKETTIALAASVSGERIGGGCFRAVRACLSLIIRCRDSRGAKSKERRTRAGAMALASIV